MGQDDPELARLLRDYRANQSIVWDRRADEIFARWRHEVGDLPWIARLLPAPLGATLDLGVGYGRLYPVYAHAVRKAGVDVSHRMLDLAAQHLPKDHGVELAECPLWQLPFADGAFDLALAVRVLNHIEPSDLRRSLKEIARVSRRLVLVEATVLRVDPRLEFAHDYAAALADLGFRLATTCHPDPETLLIDAYVH